MKKNTWYLLSLIIILSTGISLTVKGISSAQEGPWRIPIKALGQGEEDGLSGANNASTIFIGMDANAVTYEALPPPPNPTAYITILGQPKESSEDIRAIGTGRQVWYLKVKIDNEYADPNLPGYYPELFWDPNHEIDLHALMELRRSNEEGDPLVDMVETKTYETQAADGEYYNPPFDMTLLNYAVIYDPNFYIIYYRDQDGDAYGDSNNWLREETPPSGYVEIAGDCDDADPNSYLGALEVCDGKDNDCDGIIDEENADYCTTYYKDADGDTYGLDDDSRCLCVSADDYTANRGGDCDDSNNNINPDAIEECDQVDNDCDGLIDEENAADCTIYYKDTDDDSFGLDDDSLCLCSAEDDYTATEAGDCDNNNKDINPAAVEECDGIDNDCDNQIDEENAAECTIYYKDADDDSFGLDDDSLCLCTPAGDYTAIVAGDCDDYNADIKPGADEMCDQSDNNCDGQIDEGFNLGQECTVGQGACQSNGILVCSANGLSAECDAIPGEPSDEVCDGIDNDCDGLTDEENADGCVTYYIDADGDSYGLDDDSRCLCASEGDYTAIVAGDCDDSDSTRNPGRQELLNGKDDNCDSVIDKGFAPQFTTLPVIEGKVGSEYACRAVALGEIPFTWALTVKPKEPSWMSVSEKNQNTFLITGTPGKDEADNTYEFSLTVSNEGGNISQKWTLYILPVNNSLEGTIGPFGEGNEPAVRPFKMELYSMVDGLLKAGTDSPSEIPTITCTYNEYSGNYEYRILDLAKGPYSIFISDNNPEDTHNYEPITKIVQVEGGVNTVTIQMEIAPPEFHQIKGQVAGPGVNKVLLSLYGQTDTDQPLKKKQAFSLAQTGSELYCFFAPGGDYTLLAQAKGYESKYLKISDLAADQNIPIIFDNPRNPSLSIVAQQEDQKQLRLNFQYHNPDGEAEDWNNENNENNTVIVTLFTPEDDPNSTGSPSDPNLPSGHSIQLVYPNNRGNTNVFAREYLTCLLDANSYSMAHSEENNVHTYTLGARIRLIDGLGKDIIDPLVHIFEVKESPSLQKPLSQTKTTFKASELLSIHSVPISGKVLIKEQSVQMNAFLNVAHGDPLLFSTVDEKGNKSSGVDQEQPLTLQIEVKPKTDDPNCIVVDIAFRDRSGKKVEYNPPDPQTGARDENAAPIIIDIPVNIQLQGKGYSPQEAKNHIACDTDTDFHQIMGVWKTVPGKYGIYFQTSQGESLFMPGTGEGIEIISSDTGLLMARITAKHTSSWYMKSLESDAESSPSSEQPGDSVGGGGGGCFLSHFLQSLRSYISTIVDFNNKTFYFIY